MTPSSPAPGGDIALRVSGCDAKTGTAVSDAFVADIMLTGTNGTLAGESQIRSSATPGLYDVQVTCGAARVKGTITVSAADTKGADAPSTVPASPIAPVPAGGGGTAHFASDARSAGPGVAQTVTGLVLAGLAALAVGLLPRALGSARAGGTRMARRRRGTD